MIVKFDGKDIKEMRDLPRIVADTPVGKDVEVIDHPQGQGRDQDGEARPARGWREAAKASADAEAPADKPVVQEVARLELSNITDDLRKRFKIKDR